MCPFKYIFTQPVKWFSDSKSTTRTEGGTTWSLLFQSNVWPLQIVPIISQWSWTKGHLTKRRWSTPAAAVRSALTWKHDKALFLCLCPTCICWLPPECPSICALWLLSRRRWKREAEEEEEGQRIQLYETCNGDQNKHRNQLWEWGGLKAAAGWGVV